MNVMSCLTNISVSKFSSPVNIGGRAITPTPTTVNNAPKTGKIPHGSPKKM